MSNCSNSRNRRFWHSAGSLARCPRLPAERAVHRGEGCAASGTARGGELERIGQIIVQDLAHLCGLLQVQAERGRELEADIDSLAGRAQPKPIPDLRCERRQLHRVRRGRRLCAPERVHVSPSFKSLCMVWRCSRCRPDTRGVQVPPHRPCRSGAAGKADDGIQRSPELVRELEDGVLFLAGGGGAFELSV